MSTLYDQISEEEEKLKEINGEAQEEVVEEVKVNDEITDEPEVKQEEIIEPEKVEPAEEEPEELKPDASAFARMRKQTREAEEKARITEEKSKALEERLAKLEEVKPEAAPDKEDDYEAHIEYRDKQTKKELEDLKSQTAELNKYKEEEVKTRHQRELMQNAIQEFTSYEQTFHAKTPDYEQAAEHVRTRIKSSLSTLYPDASDAELDGEVARKILTLASQAVNAGYNPAEKLYYDAKIRYGYAKSTEKIGKPDINKIDKNKKKSASPLGTAGQSGARSDLTKEGLASMSLGDFGKLNLTPEKLRALED